MARADGLESKIPRRTPKKQRPRVKLSLLVLQRQGRVLLMREPNGYFSGLWHFPYVGGSALGQLAKVCGAGGPQRRASFTHQTTMRDLILTIYTAQSNGVKPTLGGTGRWVEWKKVEGLGVGSATRKVVQSLAGGADSGGVVE